MLLEEELELLEEELEELLEEELEELLEEELLELDELPHSTPPPLSGVWSLIQVCSPMQVPPFSLPQPES